MFGLFSKALPKAKTLGQLGEAAAQTEYKVRGSEILAANFFNPKGKRLGEVDFVAKNKTEIIFVEVKTRTSAQSRFGAGEEAVNLFKQRKILKAVKVYLLQHPKYQALRPQIDVCVMGYNPFDKSLKCVKIITNAVEDET